MGYYDEKERTIEDIKKLKEKRLKLASTLEKPVLFDKGNIDYFTKRIEPRIKTGVFLIFEEKHGNRYIDASNKEVFFKGVLKILKERSADGYWYDSGIKPPDLVTPDIEDIEKLPKTTVFDKLKKDAILSYYMYEKDYIKYYAEKELLNRIQYALDNNNGMAAYIILELQSKGEYEGFNWESFEKV